MITLSQIRQMFLDYFAYNQHSVIQSSSLVPQNDATLMFTNSGMVQFKSCFTGAEDPKHLRITTAQKCVRAGGKHNDLENVGYTARHHTFFEMMGNFSFGDYFKERAIELAWSFLVNELKIDKNKLYITIYHNDEDAYKIWHKLTGFGDERIIRINTNDNFWSMGDTGPCGPCSEIFYDHGPQYEGGLPGTLEADGDRYIEIWNLVFMQYEQLADGTRLLLPKPSIDTGMGLERVAAVMQGVNDNYAIDLFQNLIKASRHISGDDSLNNISSHKVIADHLRSASFLIADGVMPSNEGRGYVLRRIIRRAVRHAYKIGSKAEILCNLLPYLVAEMEIAYPELKHAQSNIASILRDEEVRFKETIGRGMYMLLEHSNNLASDSLFSGEVAFKLYDTYGFSLDLTQDILREKSIIVDQSAFDQCMNKQKERSRASWVGSGGIAEDKLWHDIASKLSAMDNYGDYFVGYEQDKVRTKVLAIVQNGKSVESAEPDLETVVILGQTPFYAESGGQVGDIGQFISCNNPGSKLTTEEDLNLVYTIVNTQKYANILHGHHLTSAGGLSVGDELIAEVDTYRRNQIRANHSATHLLHQALRTVLGEHIAQKGSLVTDEKLRFDFSHSKPITIDELHEVEKLVNIAITTNSQTCVEITNYDDALSRGVVALFGEKYDDKVRAIFMGDSAELCGGTHVKRTGDIGLLLITVEESIASGVRRIEAVTGLKALQLVQQKEMILLDMSSSLKCGQGDLVHRIKSLVEEKKRIESVALDLRMEVAMQVKNSADIDKVIDAVGIKAQVCIKYCSGLNIKELQTLSNKIRKNIIGEFILVLMTVVEQDGQKMVNVVVIVSDELSKQRNIFAANEVAKRIISQIGGKGGGQKTMAQVGGIIIASENQLAEISSFIGSTILQ